MRVREKSRNGEESGWGEFISAGRLRGENTLPINDRDVGICLPVHVSQSKPRSGEGLPKVVVLAHHPSPKRRSTADHGIRGDEVRSATSVPCQPAWSLFGRYTVSAVQHANQTTKSSHCHITFHRCRPYPRPSMADLGRLGGRGKGGG